MTSFVYKTLEGNHYSPLTILNRVKQLESMKLTKDNFKARLQDTSFLDDKKPNTKIAYCFNILSLLRGVEQDSTVERLITKYAKIIDDYKKHQIIKRNRNTRSSDFIDLETLQKLLHDSRPDLTHIGITNIAKLKQYKDLENYVLLSLYIDQTAVRNDYHDITIITNVKLVNKTDNFLVINKKGMYFVFNRFKTAHSFGQVKLPVNDTSADLIKHMLAMRKLLELHTDKLFNHISKKGINPIRSPTNMVMRIRSASVKYLGARQSINDFRHAWETYIQSRPEYQHMTLEERNAEHAKLLHHLAIALEYNRV